MKASGVIVRFLSLLDIALILLGVLMVVLMQSQLRSDATGETSSDGLVELAGIDFVYLYAGWKGADNGRCYLLSNNREIGREIRTDTADDIQEILKAQNGKPNQVVMLLFSDEGWYSLWDAKRLAALEKTWGVKVIPIYNVHLAR